MEQYATHHHTINHFLKNHVVVFLAFCYLCKGAGQYCVTGGSDGDIHLWNPYTGKLIKSYQDHARSVLSLSLFVSPF